MQLSKLFYYCKMRMQHSFKVPIVLITIVLLFNSCRKNVPTCTANCININIHGNTKNKITNAAIANVPVVVNLFAKQSYCFGCTSYKVASGVTDKDGNFDFSSIIDSALFKDYYLNVRIQVDTNYISIPLSHSIHHYSEVKFFDIYSTALQNVNFEYYPKTALTINLNRTLSDTFAYFGVEHYFSDAFRYSSYIIAGQQSATSKTLTLETSADIYTKIIWRKTTAPGIYTTKIDSILCTKNGTNTFNINY